MKPAICEHTAHEIRVTYRDTDRAGHTYYANYFVWMEIGRTELLRSLGRTYKSWEEEDGIFLPVSSCSAEYFSGAMYDELLTVHTRLVELTRASMRFEYEIRRESDGTLLATGHTTHPFVSRSEGRIVRVGHKLLPEFFLQK